MPASRTRAALCEDLLRLGLVPGDAVMVHAALRRVGPVRGGADQVIGALLDAVGPGGTILGYADWDGDYEDLLDAEGRVPPEWRPHVRPFDPAASRAIRDNGAFPELLRTTPGRAAQRQPRRLGRGAGRAGRVVHGRPPDRLGLRPRHAPRAAG